MTPRGVEQCNALAEKLKDVKLDIIYTSELQRTWQTAAIVNIRHEVPIIREPLLNDIVSGIAGRPVSEFRALLKRSDDPWNAKFSGGESYNEAKARAISFLEKLRKEPHECVLIVTSGGIANNIFGEANRLSNDEMYVRPIENCALLKIALNHM